MQSGTATFLKGAGALYHVSVVWLAHNMSVAGAEESEVDC